MWKKENLNFRGVKVYYSGSITGQSEADLEFPERLVEHIQRGGVIVLDPHVAISMKAQPEKFYKELLLLHGMDIEEWQGLSDSERSRKIYERDISLVDEATHVVSLLNGVSWGVGMEIQEALRKPAIGLPITPILGLVHKDYFNNLSLMIKGAAQIYPHFELYSYENLDDAKRAIDTFLTKSL